MNLYFFKSKSCVSVDVSAKNILSWRVIVDAKVCEDWGVMFAQELDTATNVYLLCQ